MPPRGDAQGASVVPVVATKTDRWMARIAIVIVTGGLLYGAWSLGGPVYWRVYATVIHPYQDAAHPGPSEASGATFPCYSSARRC
jgi:hypothetical protein